MVATFVPWKAEGPLFLPHKASMNCPYAPDWTGFHDATIYELNPKRCISMKLSVSSTADMEVKGAFVVSATLGGVTDAIVVTLQTIWKSYIKI